MMRFVFHNVGILSVKKKELILEYMDHYKGIYIYETLYL